MSINAPPVSCGSHRRWRCEPCGFYRTGIERFVTAVTLLAMACPVNAAATEPVHPTTSTRPVVDPEVLTTTAAVRHLPPEQAALHVPVAIRGVVTYISVFPPLLFVQDDTGGVCVSGPRDRDVKAQLKPGVLVDVEGVSAPGRPAAYITALPRETLKVTVVGEASPVSPRSMAIGKVADLDTAGSLVEISGVIRAVRTEAVGPAAVEALVISLASGRDRLDAVVLNWPAARELPRQWIGSSVRLRGIFNASNPERQPVTSMRLLVSPRDVRSIDPATRPGDLPRTTIPAVVAFGPEQVLPTRVRVTGVVTVPVLGKGLYLQDGDAGIWVDTPPADLQAGARVQLIGFPVRRGNVISLENAEWGVLESGSPPPAPLVTADAALTGTFDARLVSMEALVLSISRLSEGPTLVLQSGERVFLARAASPTVAALASISENSWVRVTGVCVNNRRPGWEESDAPAPPVSFHLLVGSPNAVQVMRSPGWLTLGRTLLIAGGLATITLAAFAWVALLRRRVARQTHLIRDHLARETLNEERMRIARDLHDSLEQDLLGITMQLTATEKLLDEPQRAKQSLHLAAAMVRRSQAETHRAVWDLRARGSDSGGLVATLRDAVAGLSPAAGPAVAVQVTGEERPLAPQVENHVLRVTLEAVTNAIKHAHASSINVALNFSDVSVKVSITDNGSGFDADRLPLPSSGHFGLFGMKERAEKLKGILTIQSRAGEGSEIDLTVPLQTKESERR